MVRAVLSRFPATFAGLAVPPRAQWELLVLDASFIPKSGRETWETGWFWSGLACAARWGLEVSLLAAAEGGLSPLCSAFPGHHLIALANLRVGYRPGEMIGDAGQALLREAVDARAEDVFQVRRVAADGGYSSQTFVEGVQEQGLHPVGWLRRDTVLYFRHTGPDERRPPRLGAHGPHETGRREGRPLPRRAARQGLAALVAGDVGLTPRCRPVDDGRGAA